MTFDEMKPGGFLYHVTKGSTDGTFDVGCILRLGKYESLDILYPIRAWLDKEELSPETVDFEVELWTCPELIDKIKDSISEKLDIKQVATIYAQAAMLKVKDHAAGEVDSKAKELWQISDWLNELVILRNLVHNTIKRF